MKLTALERTSSNILDVVSNTVDIPSVSVFLFEENADTNGLLDPHYALVVMSIDN